MKRDLYEEVTNRILTQMEAGTLPWVKPWSATAGRNVPQNAVTNRAYSGCNLVLLWLAKAEWPTRRYLTFKQAKDAGGTVRQGEHGTKVYFWKPLKVKDKDNEDEEKTIPLIREYTVFNVAQCDGLPEKILKGPNPDTPRNKDERITLADDFVKATGATIKEHYSDRACYIPSADFINIPKFSQFRDADNFYCTEFHELTHWTAHESRLNRDLKPRFDTHAYAMEELVAELGAAFLCAEFSLDGEVRDASYIKHWMETMKADKKAFFTACSKAQQAADFLRGKALEEAAQIEEAA